MIDLLIIENNDLDVERIERHLRKLDVPHRITRAEHGQEALEMLRGDAGRPAMDPPDVVFVDLSMPGMNGLELLRELRADADFAPRPVFVITGTEHAPELESARELGARDVVVKPVSLEWVRSLVGRLGHPIRG